MPIIEKPGFKFQDIKLNKAIFRYFFCNNLEYEVEVTPGWAGVVPAGPLDPHLPELGEGLDQGLLGDVPGHSAQEYLGGVVRVWAGHGGSGRELARPGAGGLAHRGGGAVEPSSPAIHKLKIS